MRAIDTSPRVDVALGGQRLPEAALAGLSTVRVARALSLPAQCEVAFSHDGHHGSAVVDAVERSGLGAALEVVVGGDPRALFVGRVSAHEWHHGPDGSVELRLRGYDALHHGRTRGQVVARVGVGLADVLADVAEQLDLRSSVDVSSSRWPVLVQGAATDLDHLVDLCGRAGVHLVVDDDTLRVVDLGGYGEPIDLLLHGSLLSARFEVNADPACRSVAVTGWDPVTGETLVGGASTPRSVRVVSTGSAPDVLGSDGRRHLTGHHGPTADHLDDVARAELDRRVAREAVFHGVAEGGADLVPGRRVRIEGASSTVPADYVITRSVHTIDAAGYLVELSSDPPERPAPVVDGRGCEVTVGTVLAVDDPDGRGRVRVGLPAFADVELDWRPVVGPGAGPRKGLVALPDVGDRVVLLLPGSDPAAALVIGGLHGVDGPPDPGVAGNTVVRWSFATPGGQTVVLDDEASRLELANADGSSVVLAPERLTIHAATDLAIEAPGRTITMLADRIDMRRATSGGG